MSLAGVRVRYAPSPTGMTHLGGLRTALFNYLFARSNAGSLVLRIEDTDQSRQVAGAVENLIDTMKWAGISFDEGPHVGGPYGPYVQSQRLEHYKEFAAELVNQKHAYRCFCTPDRLSQLRTHLHESGKQAMYDRLCLSTISRADSEARARAGEPHVVRFHVREGSTKVHDTIHGNIDFNNELIEDAVILKSDNFPTYHLASVVDDHLMKISHVIRGDEWLSSLPKHVMLYKALGLTPPIFAHLPLLVNSDHTKLSKRHAHASVNHYRQATGGIPRLLPEAVVNFVALLGWSPANDREIFSLEDLCKEFSIQGVNKGQSVVNVTKLNWLNGVHIKQQLTKDPWRLVNLVWESLPANWQTKEKDFALKVLNAIGERLEMVSDFLHEARPFYECPWETNWKPEDSSAEPENYSPPSSTEIEVLASICEQTTVGSVWGDVSKLMKKITKEKGVPSAAAMKAMRWAITGQKSGCSLGILFDVIGTNECCRRIRVAVERAHDFNSNVQN
eukprot:c5974_g1_i1.p1 GENE.c5974_g1_i1~~c5974_g1_i1.p1  ORF type:complete len:504 (+),score=91.17 c5974_g1_i1:47-1558(+)